MKALYILALMTLVACGQSEDHKSAASATDNQDVRNPETSETQTEKAAPKKQEAQALAKAPEAKAAYEPTKWVDPVTGKNWSLDNRVYIAPNKDNACAQGYRFPDKAESMAVMVSGLTAYITTNKMANAFWTKEGLVALTEVKPTNKSFVTITFAAAYCIEK